jgi:acyl-CoA synthetase (AMP-forming)/AMP-acid ligase II
LRFSPLFGSFVNGRPYAIVIFASPTVAFIVSCGLTRGLSWPSTAATVPTMVWRVCEHPARHDYDTSTVTTVAFGGSPSADELQRRIAETFPNVRSTSNAYGLTETSSVATVISGADARRKPQSVGPPVPGVDVRIVEPPAHELVELAEGAGERVSPLELPQDYYVVLVLPRGATKASTAAVYADFDERSGASAGLFPLPEPAALPVPA